MAADGIVVMIVKDWDLFQTIFQDPEYLGPISKDDEKWFTNKFDFTMGFEMPVF